MDKAAALWLLTLLLSTVLCAHAADTQQKSATIILTVEELTNNDKRFTAAQEIKWEVDENGAYKDYTARCEEYTGTNTLQLAAGETTELQCTIKNYQYAPGKEPKKARFAWGEASKTFAIENKGSKLSIKSAGSNVCIECCSRGKSECDISDGENGYSMGVSKQIDWCKVEKKEGKYIVTLQVYDEAGGIQSAAPVSITFNKIPMCAQAECTGGECNCAASSEDEMTCCVGGKNVKMDQGSYCTVCTENQLCPLLRIQQAPETPPEPCSGNDGRPGPIVCGDKNCEAGKKCKHDEGYTILWWQVGEGCSCVNAENECPTPGGPCLGTPPGECNENKQRCTSNNFLGPANDESCNKCNPDDLAVRIDLEYKYNLDYPGTSTFEADILNLGEKECVTPGVYVEFGFGQADNTYRFKDYTLSNKRLEKTSHEEDISSTDFQFEFKDDLELSIKSGGETIKTYSAAEVGSFIANNVSFKFRTYIEGGASSTEKGISLRRVAEVFSGPPFKYNPTPSVGSEDEVMYYESTAKFADGFKIIAETGPGLQYLRHTGLTMTSQTPGKIEYLIEGNNVPYRLEYTCIQEGKTTFSLRAEEGAFPVETILWGDESFQRKINCKKPPEQCETLDLILIDTTDLPQNALSYEIIVYTDSVDCICLGCKAKFYVTFPDGQIHEYESEEDTNIIPGTHSYSITLHDRPIGDYAYHAVLYAPDGTPMSVPSETVLFKVLEPIALTGSTTDCDGIPLGQCNGEGYLCDSNIYGIAHLTISAECGYYGSCSDETRVGACSEEEYGMMCKGQNGDYNLVPNERCT